MSDTYYHDTVKAKNYFENVFDGLTQHLSGEHVSAYNTLLSELDLLLSEYADNIDKIENLEYEIKGLSDELGRLGE